MRSSNEQAYFALLVEWFDITTNGGTSYAEMTRRDELRHLIETCRPESLMGAAGDVTLAKLAYIRPPKPPLETGAASIMRALTRAMVSGR